LHAKQKLYQLSYIPEKTILIIYLIPTANSFTVTLLQLAQNQKNLIPFKTTEIISPFKK